MKKLVWNCFDYLLDAHLRAGGLALFVKLCLNFGFTFAIALVLTPFVVLHDAVRFLYEKVTDEV
jgi:hypothetical protein